MKVNLPQPGHEAKGGVLEPLMSSDMRELQGKSLCLSRSTRVTLPCCDTRAGRNFTKT